MTAVPEYIKVGRQGIVIKGARIPASFFRHLMPGKSFVVLAEGDRRLMHVRAKDVKALQRAYRDYIRNLGSRRTRN
ncbi:MAG: hypothetical protein WCI95_00475 [bacterium]